MGGKPGLEWPDFQSAGVNAHPSFGYGPIYRGRLRGAKICVLADQQSHDDLFTGRALTGEAGQHFQEFLRAMGITRSYVIIRVLPVDTLDLASNTVRSIVNDPQVQKVYSAILDAVLSANRNLKLVLALGPHSRALLSQLSPSGVTMLSMKAWRQSGALSAWREALSELKTLTYGKDLRNPSFSYDGSRGQIPRFDLPYGSLRWRGTSGDRGSRPIDRDSGSPSPDYYKLYMPKWAAALEPAPLSSSERRAIRNAT